MPTKKITKKRTVKKEQVEKLTEKSAKVAKVKVKEEPEVQTHSLMPGGKYYYATGKRKTSIALVRLYKGKGAISVNNKSLNQYYSLKTLIGVIKFPLKITGNLDKFDIAVKVMGGGISSQADAIRHGISRALLVADPLLKPTLKKAGLLTRDPRIKERKKFGLKRARRGPQFSKR